jgi:hypothetical protein
MRERVHCVFEGRTLGLGREALESESVAIFLGQEWMGIVVDRWIVLDDVDVRLGLKGRVRCHGQDSFIFVNSTSTCVSDDGDGEQRWSPKYESRVQAHV